MGSQTVTNKKTSFDADTNDDYPVKVTDDGGALVQHFIADSIPDVDINDISKGTQSNDVKVTLDGETVPVNSTPVVVSSATVTEVTAGSASGTALAASGSRLAASIFNKDTAESAYLNIGAAATTSKIQLRPGEWWHMANYGVIFTEVITCIRGGSQDVTLVVVSG
jgi:hypothetical protein